MAGEAGGVCCIMCIVGALLLCVMSVTSISATEMALQYDWVFKTVSPVVIAEPGLRFVGPTKSLIKYPKTILTLEYTQDHRDVLDGRTKDGLPLVLGVAFQYRLLPEGLVDLYRMYEYNVGDYQQIFKLVGIHVITECATNYTAYQFFNEKQRIAADMRVVLDTYFRKNLFASVESLQINEDDLPEAFTETILTAATKKQDITKMQKTRDAKRIEYQTAVLVAEAQANVTIQQAMGEQHRIHQNGRADAAIIEAYVEAEKEAYSKAHTEMSLTGDDLISYIWYDTLAGGGVSKTAGSTQDSTMLVGVSPAAYISQASGSR